MASIIKVNEYKDFGNNAIMTSDGAGNVTINAAALKNTPRFLALKSNAADQTISDATGTLITFDTEIIDTDNAFASNTFTVPAGEGGTYMIGAGANIGAGTYSQLDQSIIYLVKNGTITSNYGGAFQSNPIYHSNLSYTDVQVLSAGDTLVVWAYANVNSGSGHVSGNSDLRRETYFYGYKLLT
tara:strand:- start:48 stop:599 length:552 start_codon:yes stop_codon:yes gene_type:complete